MTSVARRSQTKVILAFVLVFALGAVAGAAVGHVIETRRAIDMFDAAGQGSRHGVFLWSLERKLDLSGDQKTKITEILSHYDRDTANVAVDPRLQALRAQMRSEVRATLTAEQQPKFDELIASWDSVRKRPASSETPSPSATSSAAPSRAP